MDLANTLKIAFLSLTCLFGSFLTQKMNSVDSELSLLTRDTYLPMLPIKGIITCIPRWYSSPEPLLLQIADHHPREGVNHQALGAIARGALGMKKLSSNPSSVFGAVYVASWTSGFSSVKSQITSQRCFRD